MCQVLILMFSKSLLLIKKRRNGLYTDFSGFMNKLSVKRTGQMERSVKSHLEYFQITFRIYELYKFTNTGFYNRINNIEYIYSIRSSRSDTCVQCCRRNPTRL